MKKLFEIVSAAARLVRGCVVSAFGIGLCAQVEAGLLAMETRNKQLEGELKQIQAKRREYEEKEAQRRLVHETAMAEIRDPGGRLAAENLSYFSTNEAYLHRPNYQQSFELVLEVVENGVAPDLFDAHRIEVLELAQDMLVTYSNGVAADVFVPDRLLQGVSGKKLDYVKAILNGSSPPHIRHVDDVSRFFAPQRDDDNDDVGFFRNKALEILATFRDSLAPQIAALRIQRDMKSRIDNATASSGTIACEAVTLAPSRRRAIGI